MDDAADIFGDGRPSGDARARFLRLHDILRSRICLLDYPPGMRLSEEVIAAEFGVSRTPLRRVLTRLEAEGLLASVHGVGTFVTDVDIDELEQVYLLRMELAELLGRMSPVPPDAGGLDVLRSLAAEARRLTEAPDPRAFAVLNMAFFRALMRLTANEPLREVSERLYYRTARIWLKSIPQLNLRDETAVFAREITDVLAAVELGDLEAAGHIRRSHISMSFIRLRNTAHGH